MRSASGIRVFPLRATALAFGFAVCSHIANAQSASALRVYATESNGEVIPISAVEKRQFIDALPDRGQRAAERFGGDPTSWRETFGLPLGELPGSTLRQLATLNPAEGFQGIVETAVKTQPGAFAKDGVRAKASGPEGSRDQTRSEVGALVAERNAEASREAQAFVGDGWTLVEAPEPDPLLVSSSPVLLPQRESELLAQLASAPPGPEYLENVVEVAVRAKELHTRVAAVEAIALMGDGRPQRELLGLMSRLPPEDEARRIVVSRLRPLVSEDSTALAMAALLDSAQVTPEEKEQVAWTLALVNLGDRAPWPPALNSAVSPHARALLERANELAQRSPNRRR
jgi:hypothetical protein